MTAAAAVPSIVGDHLAALESEAVHIIREVVAEFDLSLIHI